MDQSSPSITAIIVNYRIAEDALRAAESIAGQGIAADIHIVDNSECAGQAELLRSSRWTVHISGKNLGFGAACNRVHAATDSRYVLLLNPDARLLPGALRRLVEALEDDPMLAAVGPRTWWDEQRQWLLPPALLPSGCERLWSALPGAAGKLVRARYDRQRRRRALDFWLADEPLEQPALSGGHVLLRREAVEIAGGLFDCGYFLYWEDTDLFVRLQRRGYRSRLVPQAAAVHPAGACVRAGGTDVGAHAAHSQQRYWSLHYRRSTALAGWLEEQRRSVTGPCVQRLLPGDSASVAVPSDWRGHWCLELSAEPRFLWPLASLGRGAVAALPSFVAESFGGGTGYVRLGPAATTSRELPVWKLEAADADG